MSKLKTRVKKKLNFFCARGIIHMAAYSTERPNLISSVSVRLCVWVGLLHLRREINETGIIIHQEVTVSCSSSLHFFFFLSISLFSCLQSCLSPAVALVWILEQVSGWLLKTTALVQVCGCSQIREARLMPFSLLAYRSDRPARLERMGDPGHLQEVPFSSPLVFISSLCLLLTVVKFTCTLTSGVHLFPNASLLK